MTTPAPDTGPQNIGPGRLVGLAFTTAAAVTALWLIPGPGGPPADIDGALDWWTATGTPAASIAIVRVVVLGAAIWMMSLAALAAVVSHTRSVLIARLWRRLAPTTLRRLLATSIIAAVATTPTAASAAEHVEAPLPILIDLGPADTTPTPTPALPSLVDLGPMETIPEIRADGPDLAASDPTGSEAAERWTVGPGDHLWHIAEETLIDRGLDTATDDIARYWRRLIDDNRELIGDDADLIHPGMVLDLPE